MNKRSFLFVFLVFITANSLFSAPISWTGLGTAGVWEDSDNWDLLRVPTVGDDVTINGAFTVTVASNTTVEYIHLANGADLIIAATYTVNVQTNGGDGVELDDSGTSLTINGTLNSSGHTASGIDVNKFCSLTISSTGILSISNVTGDGLELSDELTNAGSISITSPGKAGLFGGSNANANTPITNTGSITISGGTNSIDLSNSFDFTNNGIVTLSNASSVLIDAGSNIINNSTFRGDGLVQNSNDVLFSSSSTLAPGTSTGTLTFEDELDISGVSLEIEIDGANDYDSLIVNTGDLTISGASLNLSGSYIPVGGEEFMILRVVDAGSSLNGAFSMIPESSMIEFNGALFTITYMGGDGNDMTMTFDSALPIELIDFSARAMKDEVKLAWTTATETNNDFFTLERSTDGRTFEEIATILGNGNTTDISKYSYMDKNPRSGLNYYRLKQTDFDGQFSYSDIETVKFESVASISVFPTMVNDFVNIETTMTFEDDLTVVVRDLTGRVFKQIAIDKNENKVEFSLANLVPGSYFITIYNDELFQTHKIIKL